MRRFERTFKIWDFYITHSQLLLRSHKTVTHPKNIDIIFGDVDYVELPATLFGLDLVDAGPEDYRKAEQVMDGPVAAERVFAIETKGRRYLVIAAGW
ncbi:MAG TPA: hypothetical protein VGD37_40960 [Kofleriaceae bacterium]|jgi:hypothetical protein